MRFKTALSSLIVLVGPVIAFTPSSHYGRKTKALSMSTATLSPTEITNKMEIQLNKLKVKDSRSKNVGKTDLKVVYQDDHIVVVDKPAGVLCVPTKEQSHALSQAVFDAFGCESGRADKMVVHRLGMDTSGLVVFARTNEALRNMNGLFRTRRVSRKYEALVCGHIESADGVIDMPLMRDYEYPPYIRVSTDDHQKALIGLSIDDVGKKLLEQPKDSLTKYEVIGKEEMKGLPVTRVVLTSISGRTHQLNVHMAAFGHPIVGDRVYGIDGEAAPNGGLDAPTSTSRASHELQQQISEAAKDHAMCVHAKTLSFEHPVTRETLSFESSAPF